MVHLDTRQSLIFVRHGESEGNVGATAATFTDIPLTARGHAQALLARDALLALFAVSAARAAPSASSPVQGASAPSSAPFAALAGSIPPADRIIVSPFLRARETAAPTVAAFPSLPISEAPVFEFTYLDPSSCVGSSPSSRKPQVEAYWRRCDPLYRDGGPAESFADLMTRVSSFLSDAASLPGTTIVFSHCMFMQALIFHLLRGAQPGGLTPEFMRAFEAFYRGFPVPNCAILSLEMTISGWAIQGLQTSHLRSLELKSK